MARESFYVSNGPLRGNNYALDLADSHEVLFKIDEQTHVYKAVIVYDTGHGPERYLHYVGVDPTA